jgi:hypothetical protein
MSEPNEREDLESLLKAPGWLRLIQHSRKEWAGDGYAAKIKLAIKDAMEKNQNVAEAVQRVDAANDQINAVLSWPKDRVATLLSQETQRSSSMTTMNRRGGL